MATLISSSGACIARMASTVQRAQKDWRLQPSSQHHPDHDHEGQQGPVFPVVALPGVGHMPAAGEDEKEAARVFYVAATRATQRLLMGLGGDSGFGIRLGT